VASPRLDRLGSRARLVAAVDVDSERLAPPRAML